MTMTGLMIGDAPKPEKLPEPPVNMVETPTGVMNDPAKEVPKVETPKTDGTRPEGLPEKFKSVADLAKSYAELEKKQGAAPKAATPVVPATTEKVDMSAAEKEYKANEGQISDATFAALEAKGLTKEQVTTYFAGQVALATQIRAEFAEIAGGEAQLDAIRKWAPTALTAEEAAAYDGALADGNTTLAKMLLQTITARYIAANGSDPKLVTGGTVPNASGVQPFESWEQVQEAMNDKRYKIGDPAYHAKVKARMQGFTP